MIQTWGSWVQRQVYLPLCIVPPPPKGTKSLIFFATHGHQTRAFWFPPIIIYLRFCAFKVKDQMLQLSYKLQYNRENVVLFGSVFTAIVYLFGCTDISPMTSNLFSKADCQWFNSISFFGTLEQMKLIDAWFTAFKNIHVSGLDEVLGFDSMGQN